MQMWQFSVHMLHTLMFLHAVTSECETIFKGNWNNPHLTSIYYSSLILLWCIHLPPTLTFPTGRLRLIQHIEIFQTTSSCIILIKLWAHKHRFVSLRPRDLQMHPYLSCLCINRLYFVPLKKRLRSRSIIETISNMTDTNVWRSRSFITAVLREGHFWPTCTKNDE